MSETPDEFEARHGVIPIAIRADTVVKVHGVPHDLTPPEADKIARVILALAETPDGK